MKKGFEAEQERKFDVAENEYRAAVDLANQWTQMKALGHGWYLCRVLNVFDHAGAKPHGPVAQNWFQRNGWMTTRCAGWGCWSNWRSQDGAGEEANQLRSLNQAVNDGDRLLKPDDPVLRDAIVARANVFTPVRNPQLAESEFSGARWPNVSSNEEAAGDIEVDLEHHSARRTLRQGTRGQREGPREDQEAHGPGARRVRASTGEPRAERGPAGQADRVAEVDAASWRLGRTGRRILPSARHDAFGPRGRRGGDRPRYNQSMKLNNVIAVRAMHRGRSGSRAARYARTPSLGRASKGSPGAR